MSLSKLNLEPSMTFLSLFSGCGGFDLGFKAAGFRCIKAFDVNPDAVETYNVNSEANCSELDLSKWSEKLDQYVGKADIIIAGPPCQGFSVAGKRKLNDPRNHLLVRTAEIAIRLKPSIIVIENVMAARSGKHKKFWNKASANLAQNGYHITELILDCKKLGVAQIRKRAVLIATRKTPKSSIELKEGAALTLKDVLLGLPNDNSHRPQLIEKGTKTYKIVSEISSGQKLSNVRNGPNTIHTWDIPSVFGSTTEIEKEILLVILKLRRTLKTRKLGDADPVSAASLALHMRKPIAQLLKPLIKKGFIRKVGSRYDLTNTFNGKFRRLRWDQPSYTVDTRFGVPRYFIHPDENRAFTVREAARIQGFPDSFIFPEDSGIAFLLIGNAVPPPVAEKLAREIKKTFFT